MNILEARTNMYSQMIGTHTNDPSEKSIFGKTLDHPIQFKVYCRQKS